MPSRRMPLANEIDFGSESFLDVIANIVGILVILIVVAGLRVKHGPPNVEGADAELASAQAQSVRAAAAIEAENRAAQSQELAAWNAYRLEQSRREQLAAANRAAAGEQAERLRQRLRDIEERKLAQAQLNATAERWIAQIASLAAELENRKATAQQRSIAADQSAAELDDVRRQLARERSNLDFWRDQLAKHEASATRLAAEIADKNKELKALVDAVKPTTTLVHYSSPISAPISKRELHFRLEGGKVDAVPLDGLLDRVRIELSLRDDRSETSIQGVAGPVEGFRLRYSFIAAAASLSEIMASGSRRLQLVSFDVIPPTDDKRETVAAALATGSSFLERLKANPPRLAAITLWVYPNAFADLRPLQQRLHEEGYLVALRPLPMGAAISGSPLGTASRGQ